MDIERPIIQPLNKNVPEELPRELPAFGLVLVSVTSLVSAVLRLPAAEQLQVSLALQPAVCPLGDSASDCISQCGKSTVVIKYTSHWFLCSSGKS